MSNKIVQQTFYTTPDGEMFADFEDAQKHVERLEAEDRDPNYALLLQELEYCFVEQGETPDLQWLAAYMLDYRYYFLELFAKLCGVKFTNLKAKNVELRFDALEQMWSISYKGKWLADADTIEEVLECLEEEILERSKKA